MQYLKDWLGTGSINLFGKPFAGKDTCAHSLAKLLGASVIGGGDLMRNNKEHAALQSQVEDGSLAPTKEFLNIVLPHFEQDMFQGKPLILSSVGRWHGEETGVMAAAQKSGHPLKAVIYIDVSKDEVQRRWEVSRQLEDRGERKDDAEHVLERRLQEFEDKTLPVLDFYRQKGLLIEVDGIKSREDVLHDIYTKLTAFAQATNGEIS